MEPGVDRIDITLVDGRPQYLLNGGPSDIRKVEVEISIGQPNRVMANGARVVKPTKVYRDGVLLCIDWAGSIPWE